MKIVIAGLGLIGGSFAKALKRAGGHEVRAFEKNQDILSLAKANCDIIDAAGEAELSQAGLVLIALPPAASAEFLSCYAPVFSRNTLVLDTCGVKTGLCQLGFRLAAEYGFRFTGGHPMAGRECSGYKNSLPDLFDGASFILTPGESAVPDWLEELLRSVGFAKILQTTPENHDRMIAYTSQIPHVLAWAYIMDSRSAEHSGYSAGSFRDVIRVAGVDENLWTQLFLENRQELAKGIKALRERLFTFEECLQTADGQALKDLLRKGRLKKEATEP